MYKHKVGVVQRVPKDIAMEALRIARYKLPIKTKILTREGQ